jgi:hypothetical protein
VIIFLDDKGAVPLSQALERMLYREELRTLTRSKLIDVIDGVIASIDAEPPSPLQELISNEPATGESSLGADQQTAERQTSYRTDTFEINVDADQRGKFLRKLFAGDVEEFNSVLRRVLGCSDWREAAGMLDRYYAKKGIDPDSSTAMELAQALHRSFA